MDRRKSIKIIGGSVVGVAGLVFANWRWQISDRLTHDGFFSADQEKLISTLAETFIPDGLPPVVASGEANPIGALSTGTDQFLIKLFEKCYEKPDQDLIRNQLDALIKSGFENLPREDREKRLLSMRHSETESERRFYEIMRSDTIMGFTTVREVMVKYRGYQVAPGYYKGCADVDVTNV